MPDLIRQTIDLQTNMEEVYRWSEDPAAGELVAPAKETGVVMRDDHGRVSFYKTKRGTVKFTLHNYPRYWTAEYHWGGWRANYEVRLESFGETWTRMTIEIDLQPSSFRARVQSSATRSRTKRYLNARFTAAADKFKAK